MAVGCSNLRCAITLKNKKKGVLINGGNLATSGLVSELQMIDTGCVLWASVISFVMIKLRNTSQMQRRRPCLSRWDFFQTDSN